MQHVGSNPATSYKPDKQVSRFPGSECFNHYHLFPNSARLLDTQIHIKGHDLLVATVEHRNGFGCRIHEMVATYTKWKLHADLSRISFYFLADNL